MKLRVNIALLFLTAVLVLGAGSTVSNKLPLSGFIVGLVIFLTILFILGKIKRLALNEIFLNSLKLLVVFFIFTTLFGFYLSNNIKSEDHAQIIATVWIAIIAALIYFFLSKIKPLRRLAARLHSASVARPKALVYVLFFIMCVSESIAVREYLMAPAMSLMYLTMKITVTLALLRCLSLIGYVPIQLRSDLFRGDFQAIKNNRYVRSTISFTWFAIMFSTFASYLVFLLWQTSACQIFTAAAIVAMTIWDDKFMRGKLQRILLVVAVAAFGGYVSYAFKAHSLVYHVNIAKAISFIMLVRWSVINKTVVMDFTTVLRPVWRGIAIVVFVMWFNFFFVEPKPDLQLLRSIFEVKIGFYDLIIGPDKQNLYFTVQSNRTGFGSGIGAIDLNGNVKHQHDYRECTDPDDIFIKKRKDGDYLVASCRPIPGDETSTNRIGFFKFNDGRIELDHYCPVPNFMYEAKDVPFSDKHIGLIHSMENPFPPNWRYFYWMNVADCELHKMSMDTLRPWGMICPEETRKCYVSGWKSSYTLSEISFSPNGDLIVSRGLSLGFYSLALYYDEENHKLLVTRPLAGTLDVVDVAHFQRERRIPVTSMARAVALIPEADLMLVAEFFFGTVYIHRYSTGEELARFEAGKFVRELIWDKQLQELIIVSEYHILILPWEKMIALLNDNYIVK
jgi:hypothetical protein